MLPVFGRGLRQHALNVCAARGAFYAEISFGAGTVSASGGIEMSEFINVKSEIGRLRRVMLHRPGIELQNLMPDYLERMLAEDTPDVRRAGEEHDVFAGILRANGVDVKNRAAVNAYFDKKEADAKAAEEAAKAAEAEVAAKNSTEGLLKQILAELKENKN